MKPGAAYIRVSTEDQTEYSPEAQLTAIRDYARKNNIALGDGSIYRDEGFSGRRAEKRPAFQAMISAAKSEKSPFEVILVHRFDRFARNREDSIVYKSLLRKECGVRVISVSEPLEDDKMAVIIEAMLEAMAEYYSLNLADEVRKGMFEKARRGENIGRAPYGYRLEGKALVPAENEAPVVKMIFGMYETESVSKILRHLNQNGIAARRGGKWTRDSLLYLLGNPVYMGVLRYNYRKGGRRGSQNKEEDWILAPSGHKPLISAGTFETAREKLMINRGLRVRGSSAKSVGSWAQRLVKCGMCGGALTLGTCGGGKYKAFRCPRNSSGTCACTNVLSARKTENLILGRVKEDFNFGGALVIEKIRKEAGNGALLDLLRARLKKLESRKALLKEAYLAEADTLEEYISSKKELDKERERIISEISDAENPSGTPDEGLRITANGFVQLLENEALSLETRNNIAKRFIKEATINLKTQEFSVIYYY